MFIQMCIASGGNKNADPLTVTFADSASDSVTLDGTRPFPSAAAVMPTDMPTVPKSVFTSACGRTYFSSCTWFHR